MTRTIWITTVGMSPMAVVNTIWAVQRARSLVINTVILLHQPTLAILKNLATVKQMLSKVLSRPGSANNIGFKDAILPEENVQTYLRVMQEQIHQCTNLTPSESPGRDPTPPEIYMDMTPGRKFMSLIVGLYGLAHSDRIRAVFYNHLTNDVYINCPLPLIPTVAISIYDISQYPEMIRLFETPADATDPSTSRVSDMSMSILGIFQTTHAHELSKGDIQHQLQTRWPQLAIDRSLLYEALGTLITQKDIEVKQVKRGAEPINMYRLTPQGSAHILFFNLIEK